MSLLYAFTGFSCVAVSVCGLLATLAARQTRKTSEQLVQAELFTPNALRRIPRLLRGLRRNVLAATASFLVAGAAYRLGAAEASLQTVCLTAQIVAAVAAGACMVDTTSAMVNVFWARGLALETWRCRHDE